MEKIGKLENTQKNLLNEVRTEITAASISTVQNQIKQLNEELPDNAILPTKIQKKKLCHHKLNQTK